MTLKKFLCATADCESENFELYMVKKQYVVVRCLDCFKKTRIHRTHIPSIFGKTLNGEQIKEILEFDLPEIK